MPLHPAQHIEAGGTGHLNVEEHNRRKTISRPVSVFVLALEVFDGFSSVRNNLDGILPAVGF